MLRQDKERIVAELSERLRTAETLLVADYRGLTMPQIDGLREELLKRGARFTVVKNTLTRRAAEEAGVESLLALLEGPTAIAFLEADGDPAAVAKALSDAARETRVLELKGGVLQGRVVTGTEIEDLAKLPPLEILRGQVLGAVVAPLNAIAGLVNAPLQNLYGLIDARIEQLGGEEAGAATSAGSEGGDGAVAAAEPSTATEDGMASTEGQVTESTEEPAEGSADVPEENAEAASASGEEEQ